MRHQTITTARFRLLGIAIGVVQLFDLLIHAATNQIEPIRVFSNLVILLWLAFFLSGRIGAGYRRMATGSIGAYIPLNGIFLFQEGVTNPQQGGEVRWMLFLLIFLTTSIAALFIYARGKPIQP